MRLSVAVPLVLVVIGCRTKATKTSCDAVGEHLAVLDAGRMANFMTEKERASRAKRWVATCESMNEEQRKCSLAATSTQEAGACTNARADGAGADQRPTTTAKWIRPGNDGGIVRHVAIASERRDRRRQLQREVHSRGPVCRAEWQGKQCLDRSNVCHWTAALASGRARSRR